MRKTFGPTIGSFLAHLGPRLILVAIPPAAWKLRLEHAPSITTTCLALFAVIVGVALLMHGQWVRLSPDRLEVIGMVRHIVPFKLMKKIELEAYGVVTPWRYGLGFQAHSGIRIHLRTGGQLTVSDVAWSEMVVSEFLSLLAECARHDGVVMSGDDDRFIFREPVSQVTGRS